MNGAIYVRIKMRDDFPRKEASGRERERARE
jgi:hypothetical protein